ncbi:glycoside hydrolase family 2 TIM barrel-domain containing protein [Maribellus sediminis]|uniref:glycoside hydrolase family 2 TIM barrel-domain containing protein n=1 Tax=Maribellus sediminis TaxID=2696285 RepID=UPI001431261A|nr:glycoside hydrolase family 2 TIM barrel-domain containing protein [Maribellus sediminis]
MNTTRNFNHYALKSIISYKIPGLLLTLIFHISVVAQSNQIDLSGTWEVKLDPENEWVKKGNCKSEGNINLPASLAEFAYGFKTDSSDFGILTPSYKYIGKAWYSREIEIPSGWKNKQIEVHLERVLWESRVFIDGTELSRNDALGTAHLHQLGELKPGVHQLTVLVDNEMIHNIGDKGHGYGEYTQSIWNGIVGRMEMKAFDPVHITAVRTFPNLNEDLLTLEVNLNTAAKKAVVLSYNIKSLNENSDILHGEKTFRPTQEQQQFVLEIPVEGKLKKWSEFSPEVYELELKLSTGNNSDSHATEFGYYEVSKSNHKVLINGKPVFLRGNLDCVHFPITGYPSCNIEDWQRIFNIYKDYGLNHVRFHSWCPPEAAFKAANRVGIYIQAEASIWIDWWMSVDNTERGRPEMNTKGFPKGLGYNASRDSFVVKEMNRVVDFYGNNPSFTMFCIGNELGNSDFDVMEEWVADLKEKDPRRLYAVSTARKITEVDDYSATHSLHGIGRTRGLNGPRTNWDFEENYGKMDIPIIAHEIGQWPVYPRWTEIDKYTGTQIARNLQEMKVQAEKNGIAGQNEKLVQASGALNQIMYKYETESFLRTESCAGVQLLSMQDYQGQGEALIGWLDCFWDSKEITTPEKFRQHFTTTVPLLRMEKMVWQSNEIFTAESQLAHYGETDLNEKCSWTITDNSGNVLAKGNFKQELFEQGSLSNLGKIEFNLNQLKSAQELVISIEVENTGFRNSWNIWVYPEALSEVKNSDEILVCSELTGEALQQLNNGKMVLLNANKLGTEENSVAADFYPLYWSLTFFPGQGKTNIGLAVDEYHPAFTKFPTSYHSDWQWESISKNSKGFILNDLPTKYAPIAQPVDDFHRNNKIGSIFELKVGKGKLLVCGYDLGTELPVARQLKYSLLTYMQSDAFDPKQSVSEEWLQSLFPRIPTAENAQVDSDFENAIFHLKAAAKLDSKNENLPWSENEDQVIVANDVSYTVKADGILKDDHVSSWHGKEMEVNLKCPDGILGTLLVHFSDWNNNGRTGILEFEGRKTKLEKHSGDGQWVKFHVMREDSNDGRLKLKTSALTGPNLMISEIILLKE